MKRILLFGLLFPTLAFAQIKDSVGFGYTRIDTVKATKDELYSYSKIWLAKAFNSSKSVIQLDDKEAGSIICKGQLLNEEKLRTSTVHYDSKYTLEITVRDNKYRIKIYDFVNEGYIVYTGVLSGTEKVNGYGLLYSDSNFQELAYAKEKSIPLATQFSNDIINSYRESMNNQIKQKNDF